MHIGIKIKQLRISQGLTQQEFADKLFISYQSVSNWERQKRHPTAEMMLTMIETFNLPLDFFIMAHDKAHDNEEDLILSAFLTNMSHNLDEIPTLKSIQKVSGISIHRIKAYFPSFDDIIYAFINKIDQSIKTQVADSLATNKPVLDTFFDDMAPMLYQKKDALHILYTRPYIRGVWTQFIRSKYKYLLVQYNRDNQTDALRTEYLIETLMAFISVWMSQEIPEPLSEFQSRIRQLTDSRISIWLS